MLIKCLTIIEVNVGSLQDKNKVQLFMGLIDSYSLACMAWPAVLILDKDHDSSRVVCSKNCSVVFPYKVNGSKYKICNFSNKYLAYEVLL